MAFDFLKAPVRQAVNLLVYGRYDNLVELTHGVRLNKEMIEWAISQHGRDLTSPPEAAYDSMNVIEVHGASPPQWSIVFDLWTCQEGQSDLSLALTVKDVEGDYVVELDDIRVL